MKLLDAVWLNGLWVAGAMLFVLAMGALARRRSLRRFYARASDQAWAGRASVRRGIVRAVLGGLCLACVSVALARPAYDPRPVRVSRSGRDVVFVIDVSRSMLTEDVKPSRLERAKLSVRDVLDVVRGDRVGIVAFAGSAVVRSPLTSDYAFARLALDQLSPDAVGRGGTAIGDGLRAALRLLFPEREGEQSLADTGRFRDIILITDGEDQESEPVAAAQAAAAKGVRIVAIGIGSELEGGLVPAAVGGGGGKGAQSERYMQFRGESVRSKLNPASLKAIAEAGAPGSVMLNVGTGNIELDKVYERLMENASRQTREDTTTVRYREAFQVLLGLALAFGLAETLLAGRLG